MDGEPGDVVGGALDLTGVQAGANVEAEARASAMTCSAQRTP